MGSEMCIRDSVRRCDPIKVPDVERYDNWKNLQLNFDPREILRG